MSTGRQRFVSGVVPDTDYSGVVRAIRRDEDHYLACLAFGLPRACPRTPDGYHILATSGTDRSTTIACTACGASSTTVRAAIDGLKAIDRVLNAPKESPDGP